MNKNKRKKILKRSQRNREEKMNKLQIRRRKISDKLSAISKANIEFMKILYQLHGLFDFVTWAVNILIFCYIYEN